MTSKTYFSYLRGFALSGAIFMLIESVFHFSGVRTHGIEKIWPEDAVTFIRLFTNLWASASLMLAVTLFYVQAHMTELKKLFVWMAIPTTVHGLLLFYLAMTPYTKILPLPNLYAWMPFYETWIRTEGGVLLIYSLYVLYGKHKKFL